MAEPFFAAENQYSATKMSQNRSGFDHAVKAKLAVAEYTIGVLNMGTTVIKSAPTTPTKVATPSAMETTPQQELDQTLMEKAVFGAFSLIEEFWNGKPKAYSAEGEGSAPATAFDRVQAILRDGVSVSSQRQSVEDTVAPSDRFSRFLHRARNGGEDSSSVCNYSIVISSQSGESFEVKFSSRDNQYGLRSAIFSPKECQVTVAGENLGSIASRSVLEQLQARVDGEGQIQL